MPTPEELATRAARYRQISGSTALTPEQIDARRKVAEDAAAAARPAAPPTTTSPPAGETAEQKRVREAEAAAVRAANERQQKIEKVQKYLDTVPAGETEYRNRVQGYIDDAKKNPPQMGGVEGMISFINEQDLRRATGELAQGAWNGIKWNEFGSNTQAGRTLDNVSIAAQGWGGKIWNGVSGWFNSMADPNDGYADSWGPTLLKGGAGLIAGVMGMRLIGPMIDKIPVLGWPIFSWIPKLAIFALAFLGGGKILQETVMSGYRQTGGGDRTHVPRDAAPVTTSSGATIPPSGATGAEETVDSSGRPVVAGPRREPTVTTTVETDPDEIDPGFERNPDDGFGGQTYTASYNPGSYAVAGNGRTVPGGQVFDDVGYEQVSYAGGDARVTRRPVAGNDPGPGYDVQMAA